MIRLVTCDIDGTLLHGEETSIDTETLEEIRRLREKGILFCPASGRQYHSLRRLFAPVQDEIAYICENGSVVFGPGNPGPVWGKVPLERSLAVQLCGILWRCRSARLTQAVKTPAMYVPAMRNICATCGRMWEISPR